jgi:hypothetical protein
MLLFAIRDSNEKGTEEDCTNHVDIKRRCENQSTQVGTRYEPEAIVRVGENFVQDA